MTNVSPDWPATAVEFKATAETLMNLINGGMDIWDAVEAAGLTEDNVCSENPEALFLDDDDNDEIDFYGWCEIDDTHSVHYLLQRSGRRGRKTPFELVEIRRATAKLKW